MSPFPAHTELLHLSLRNFTMPLPIDDILPESTAGVSVPERPSQNIDMLILKRTASRNSDTREALLCSSRAVLSQRKMERRSSGILRCCQCQELVQWTGFAKAERTQGREAVCRTCCRNAMQIKTQSFLGRAAIGDHSNIYATACNKWNGDIFSSKTKEATTFVN